MIFFVSLHHPAYYRLLSLLPDTTFNHKLMTAYTQHSYLSLYILTQNKQILMCVSKSNLHIQY